MLQQPTHDLGANEAFLFSLLQFFSSLTFSASLPPPLPFSLSLYLSLSLSLVLSRSLSLFLLVLPLFGFVLILHTEKSSSVVEQALVGENTQ